jgi:hypothetical protein
MKINLIVLLPVVRRVLADPKAPITPTEDAALDRALAALASSRVQNLEFPFWLVVGTEPDGQACQAHRP